MIMLIVVLLNQLKKLLKLQIHLVEYI